MEDVACVGAYMACDVVDVAVDADAMYVFLSVVLLSFNVSLPSTVLNGMDSTNPRSSCCNNIMLSHRSDAEQGYPYDMS